MTEQELLTRLKEGPVCLEYKGIDYCIFTGKYRAKINGHWIDLIAYKELTNTDEDAPMYLRTPDDFTDFKGIYFAGEYEEEK